MEGRGAVPRRKLVHSSHYPAKPVPFYRRFSRKVLLISLGIFLALLALILGLSIGLTRHHKQNLPLPNSHGGPYTGDLTYYGPGLGACGVTSNSNDKIVSVSHIIFDAVQKGGDPNPNPLCGKKIRIRRSGQDDRGSVDVTVVDRCTGCQSRDLDVSLGVFTKLADEAEGRVTAAWTWLEDVPEQAQG